MCLTCFATLLAMAIRFHHLPEDCSCLGEGLAPISSVPRVGAMPELVTYKCPVCGHVETIENLSNESSSRFRDLSVRSAFPQIAASGHPSPICRNGP